MKFHTRFAAPKHPPLLCTMEERRTKSEFKDECDINLIMARYRKTGVLPESALSAAARYGDFSQVPDFMEMRHKIIAAEEVFAALPAEVRKQFNNDPGAFIDAADTVEGRALMVKLGLGPEAPSSPQERPSSSGGGQPPKPSPKTERKPNEALKASKTEESSQDSE